MLNLIYSILLKIKNQKKHDVLKLKWQQAELEKKLRELKKDV